MIPWCDGCDTAVASDEADGNVFLMEPEAQEVADHLALRQLSKTWAPGSGRIH